MSFITSGDVESKQIDDIYFIILDACYLYQLSADRSRKFHELVAIIGRKDMNVIFIKAWLGCEKGIFRRSVNLVRLLVAQVYRPAGREPS